MVLVASALAWGTYLESTQGAKVSRATVYGSWWFVGLMGLICVSLVFAVITRYPWRRKHVGFITVHAGLIILIIGGFWSLFGRLEGHVTIEEGTASNVLEVDEDVIEVAEFQAGHRHVVATLPAPTRPGTVVVDGMRLEVTAIWKNTASETYVADDGPSAFRAVEVSMTPGATSGDWVGDESRSGGAATLSGLAVRVLADGAGWTPPQTAAPESPGFVFTVGSQRYPLGEVGSEAAPGWRVVSVQRFQKATVAGGQISEGAGPENPAVEVVIGDGAGTTERHTAFQNFPGMVMSRRIEGEGASGATLAYAAARQAREELVIYGPTAAPKVGYVGTDGVGREIASPERFPVEVQAGDRRVTLLRQFTRARVASKIVEAPVAGDRRPAVVLRPEGGGEAIAVAWKDQRPLPVTGRNVLIGYGPRSVELPFTIRLNDFRKMDYPGTAMAMAYESDVVISSAERGEEPFLVHMNSPYEHAPWKVYQSGFVGETVSVLSVMRDPGLGTTYLGSVVLCVGIFLTFFSRSLSWGHPGIPAPAFEKERTHEGDANVAVRPHPDARGAAGEPAGVGS
ncbi:MAG: hypothetical protein DYG92_00360 [Leptolyngbya sp. PLA1]|nr:hypothetical protein [Leptolyngbya sp. PLA1]